MKEEKERILKYIGDIYDKRRLERTHAKEVSNPTPEHEDIIKAGKKIRSFREKKRMSLEQLAVLTGLTASYLAQIEIGEADPYMTEIYDITQALGIDLSDLFIEK